GPPIVNCRKYPHDKHGQIRCPRIHRAVCGTDGLTYGNECMLCAKIIILCIFEFTKPIEYCPMNYDPVCGTDGVTYGNKCEFCKRQQVFMGKHKSP
uniref:Kazal-like domain-containing protein n=1 Tax=Salvator merianae TaxID=96440 RepID=A0A8D0B7P1_SALMN